MCASWLSPARHADTGGEIEAPVRFAYTRKSPHEFQPHATFREWRWGIPSWCAIPGDRCPLTVTPTLLTPACARCAAPTAPELRTRCAGSERLVRRSDEKRAPPSLARSPAGLVCEAGSKSMVICVLRTPNWQEMTWCGCHAIAHPRKRNALAAKVGHRRAALEDLAGDLPPTQWTRQSHVGLVSSTIMGAASHESIILLSTRAGSSVAAHAGPGGTVRKDQGWSPSWRPLACHAPLGPRTGRSVRPSRPSGRGGLGNLARSATAEGAARPGSASQACRRIFERPWLNRSLCLGPIPSCVTTMSYGFGFQHKMSALSSRNQIHMGAPPDLLNAETHLQHCLDT